MKTDTLKQYADTAFNHTAKKMELAERAKQQLYVAHNGGLFKATPEMITFLNMDWNYIDDKMVVEDSYGNPIMVERKKLQNELISAYKFVMNKWYKDFEDLKNIRKGSHV